MENKSNKGLIGLVIVLIIMVLGLGGYIAYDKVLSAEKDNKQVENINKEQKEEKYEEISVDDETVTKLIKNLTADTIDGNKAGYFYEKDKMLNTEVSNQMKLYLAIQMIQGDVDDMEKNLSKVTPKNISSAVKEIFGPDATYTDETLNDACRGMKYNSKTKTYSANYGCGSMLTPHYDGLIIEAKKYDERLEIEQKVMLTTYDIIDDDTFKVNISNLNEIIDSITLKSDEDEPETKDLLNKYKSKLNTYKYTFNKNGDNYYFYSVERVKN